MTEQDINKHNSELLLKIDNAEETGGVRDKVEQTLLSLSVYMPAIIHKDVFRTEAEQLHKYNSGVSQVKWGFHCFTRKGQPTSLAADIISADYNYFDDKQFVILDTDQIFWMLLGQYAMENSLRWGGFWGLEKNEVGFIQRIFESDDFGQIESYAYLVNQGKKRLGWDVAHVETSRLSVVEAYKLKS